MEEFPEEDWPAVNGVFQSYHLLDNLTVYESIDLPLLDGIGQPVEEAVVFEAAFMAMELMTKVPVGGMQDFHEKSTRIQERCQRHPMETR